MKTTEILDSLVPITLFNQGQASKIIDRVKTKRQLVIMKNNVPTAVILSMDEYARLAEIEEDYQLLTQANARLSGTVYEKALTHEEVMKTLNLSQADIDSAEDMEFE